MKRFTDTEIWFREWFMKLAPDEKAAFQFIKDRCDCVGVWATNMMLLKMLTGYTGTIEDLVPKCNGNLELFKGKVFLPDFCQFQYGNLSETCKPHRKYIQELQSHDLLERILKGYPKGLDTLQEKEQEKEKEKEENNKGEEEGVGEEEPTERQKVSPTYFMDFVKSKGHVYKDDLQRWRAAINEILAKYPDDPIEDVVKWAAIYYEYPIKKAGFFVKDSWPSILNAYRNRNAKHRSKARNVDPHINEKVYSAGDTEENLK